MRDSRVCAMMLPVTFLPPTSLGGGGSGGLVTQGTVPWVVDGSAVVQPVSGTVTALQGTIPWDTDGLTDAELRATPVPVLGPLTDAELRATPVDVLAAQGTTPWVVDGSAVTQPVSVEELPLPEGAATEATLSELLATAQGQALLLALLTSHTTDVDVTDLVLVEG